ncbi:hypothetical protein C8R45DRAFT_1035943 [Mycena sanguinolenta]|nr:hypothetical protein C8R45DRAFT_1035943 [Mycena sanguinolenta]
MVCYRGTTPTMPSLLSANRVFRRDMAPENKIPVGAMVGGLVGGVAVAILAFACYMLWSRTMQKAKEQRKNEADAQHKTKSNTFRNGLTKPWPAASYRPTLLQPAKTRVKFTEMSGDGLTTPSAPKPLRSVKKTKAASTAQLHPPMTSVPRLPSTVSSVSMYSAASGEERQVRVPTSLILALGSIEAALTRASWGDRKAPPHRVSQATSGSAYSQDVGVAY